MIRFQTFFFFFNSYFCIKRKGGGGGNIINSDTSFCCFVSNHAFCYFFLNFKREGKSISTGPAFFKKSCCSCTCISLDGQPELFPYL